MGELGRTPAADGTVEHAIGPMTSGILRGIEDGWFMAEIAEAAFQYQIALEKGDKKVVGVNVHTESVTHELEILRVSHEVEREQVRRSAQRRAARDDAAVAPRLATRWSRWRADDGEHGPGRCSTRCAPRPRWARSATRCATCGASTGSPRGSEARFLSIEPFSRVRISLIPPSSDGRSPGWGG